MGMTVCPTCGRLQEPKIDPDQPVVACPACGLSFDARENAVALPAARPPAPSPPAPASRPVAHKGGLPQLAWLLIMLGMVLFGGWVSTYFTMDRSGASSADRRPFPEQLISARLPGRLEGARVVHLKTAKNPAGEVEVRWDMGISLTEGTIPVVAKIDVVDILKAIAESGVDYDAVTVVGSHPAVDKYGNRTSEVVVEAAYDAATVRRINWDGFSPRNVYELADKVRLHPALRDDAPR